MEKYINWLNSDTNLLYFFITWILLALVVFIIVYIWIFIDETIEKNKKVEELEKEIKKMKRGKRK